VFEDQHRQITGLQKEIEQQSAVLRALDSERGSLQANCATIELDVAEDITGSLAWGVVFFVYEKYWGVAVQYGQAETEVEQRRASCVALAQRQSDEAGGLEALNGDCDRAHTELEASRLAQADEATAWEAQIEAHAKTIGSVFVCVCMLYAASDCWSSIFER
jgi:hypothetical protein